MVVAEGAAKTFGTEAQIDDPTEDGQVTQQAWVIKPVELGDGPATATATRAGQGTFDGQDEFALRVDLSLEHTDIRDIERDRNERLLVHVRPSFQSRCES